MIVHTYGWVEGLGAEITAKFAQMLAKPSTQCICLTSESKTCEVELNSRQVWHTVIKGDLRSSVAQKRTRNFISYLLPTEADSDFRYPLAGLMVSQALMLAMQPVTKVSFEQVALLTPDRNSALEVLESFNL